MHSPFAIGQLRTLNLTNHHNSRRDMRQLNLCLNFVHILSTGTTRTRSLHFNIIRIHLNLNGIIHQWIHIHRNKTRMAFRIRIKRRNPHQSVNTVFPFQIAKRKLTINFQRNRFHARNITFLIVQLLDLISILFSPHQIHAHQHSSPITRFSSARTCSDLQHSTQLITFFRKHIAELNFFQQLQRLICLFINIFLRSFAHIFVEIIQHFQLLSRMFHLVIIANPAFFRIELLQMRLRRFRFVPKLRRSRFFLIIGNLNQFFINFKISMQIFYPLQNIL